MRYTAIFAICHYMQYTTICNMLQYAICYNMQYATISNILQYAIYCNMQVRRHLQVPAPGSTCAQLRLDACLKLILRAVEPINLLPYLAPPPSVAPSPPASSPPACCIPVSFPKLGTPPPPPCHKCTLSPSPIIHLMDTQNCM